MRAIHPPYIPHPSATISMRHARTQRNERVEFRRGRRISKPAHARRTRDPAAACCALTSCVGLMGGASSGSERRALTAPAHNSHAGRDVCGRQEPAAAATDMMCVCRTVVDDHRAARVPADAVDTPAGWPLPEARGGHRVRPVQWTSWEHLLLYIRVAVAIKQATAHAGEIRTVRTFARLHL